MREHVVVADFRERGVREFLAFGDEQESRRAVNAFREMHAGLKLADRQFANLPWESLLLRHFEKEPHRIRTAER